MYLTILKSPLNDYFSIDEEQEVNTLLRCVVGTVVLLFSTLSAEDLERLLFPSLFTSGIFMQQMLDPLHAIFKVPKDLQKPIQIQHASFRDFSG
jgi:hypothetical protein